MQIDTTEVVNAMNKMERVRFSSWSGRRTLYRCRPVLFYLSGRKLGYHSQIILSGRKLNDGMGIFIADAAIKKMILANKTIKNANVYIYGITFKENCTDIRNSKVEDIIKRLR